MRPDVAFISLQLMSYRWYALNKTVKYPNVVFPGRSHWPDEHGYSLQKFFEANILQRPIHVYGGETDCWLKPLPPSSLHLPGPSRGPQNINHTRWTRVKPHSFDGRNV